MKDEGGSKLLKPECQLREEEEAVGDRHLYHGAGQR